MAGIAGHDNGIMPRHLAVIMDGNGRWAARRGLPRTAGHRAGARAARMIVESAFANGIGTLTLFAFSSENWRRPSAEVRILMDLFRRTLRRELPDLKANNVCLNFIGARHHFSDALCREMDRAERETVDNDGLQLVIAIDYGGRWDIAHAAAQLAQACAQGSIDSEDIDEDRLAEKTSLHAFGEPDLFVRTGGEQRLSNFLLWDLAYSELYFTDILWPDFDEQALLTALQWYAGRERRFGRVHCDDQTG